MATAVAEAEHQLLVAKTIITETVEQLLWGHPAHVREDAEADVLVAIWRKSLPRFDQSRGRLKPFLRRCAENAVRNFAEQLLKKPAPDPLTGCNEPAADDTTDIDQLAEELTRNPEARLDTKRAKQLRDWFAIQNITELAKLWDVNEAAAHMRMSRLRRAVAKCAG